MRIIYNKYGKEDTDVIFYKRTAACPSFALLEMIPIKEPKNTELLKIS